MIALPARLERTILRFAVLYHRRLSLRQQRLHTDLSDSQDPHLYLVSNADRYRGTIHGL